jgi:acetyl-CoA carboxylase biotin carboxyl carrier protein
MAESDLDLASIERLIKLVESRDLAELVVEEEGLKVTIRGASYARHSAAAMPVSPAPPSTDLVVAGYDEVFEELEEEPEDERIPVPSPMVGVFYRTSGPDAAPYVEIGDRVEVGQIVGLIEAMKVYSEVPSDAAGTVAAIAASNGQLVRSGDPLIFLTPD